MNEFFLMLEEAWSREVRVGGCDAWSREVRAWGLRGSRSLVSEG